MDFLAFAPALMVLFSGVGFFISERHRRIGLKPGKVAAITFEATVLLVIISAVIIMLTT